MEVKGTASEENVSDSMQKYFNLKWNRRDFIPSSICDLFPLQTAKDMTLICFDGSIGCHKIVMAASSIYLEKILIEFHNNSTFAVHGISIIIVRILLDFIYNENILVHQSLLCSVVDAGIKFQVKGILEILQKKEPPRFLFSLTDLSRSFSSGYIVTEHSNNLTALSQSQSLNENIHRGENNVTSPRLIKFLPPFYTPTNPFKRSENAKKTLALFKPWDIPKIKMSNSESATSVNSGNSGCRNGLVETVKSSKTGKIESTESNKSTRIKNGRVSKSKISKGRTLHPTVISNGIHPKKPSQKKYSNEKVELNPNQTSTQFQSKELEDTCLPFENKGISSIVSKRPHECTAVEASNSELKKFECEPCFGLDLTLQSCISKFGMTKTSESTSGTVADNNIVCENCQTDKPANISNTNTHQLNPRNPEPKERLTEQPQQQSGFAFPFSIADLAKFIPVETLKYDNTRDLNSSFEMNNIKSENNVQRTTKILAPLPKMDNNYSN